VKLHLSNALEQNLRKAFVDFARALIIRRAVSRMPPSLHPFHIQLCKIACYSGK
jgi:hypothetical protein